MKRTFLLAVFLLAAAGENSGVAQVSSPYLNITSAGNTTFTVGQQGSFMVTTEPTAQYGFPAAPVLDTTGGVGPPPGVLFTDNGDFTASLAGTPINSGDYFFVIRAYAPGMFPGTKGELLVTQNFAASVNPGQTTTDLVTQCARTFTEGQPFTYYANAHPVGTGTVAGTMTFTQDPGSVVLCSIGFPAGNSCTTTSLATSGPDTQDAYLLGASFSGNTDWGSSSALPLGVTVLSSADVVFRNGAEYVFDGCPAG